MKINKLLIKYLILLMVYVVLVRFIEPYAMRLYFSFSESPHLKPETFQTFQSLMTGITFLINLIFMVYMIIDSKDKIIIDWLIILITLFSPDAGIAIFIVWQIYKELIKKYEAQHSI